MLGKEIKERLPGDGTFKHREDPFRQKNPPVQKPKERKMLLC